MNYETKLKSDQMDGLFEAVLLLEDMDECYRFFEDICTIKELKSIAQRLQVAKLLKQNHTYNEIENATGASTATISRINRSVTYGAGGYDIILQRLGYGDLKK